MAASIWENGRTNSQWSVPDYMCLCRYSAMCIRIQSHAYTYTRPHLYVYKVIRVHIPILVHTFMSQFTTPLADKHTRHSSERERERARQTLLRLFENLCLLIAGVCQRFFHLSCRVWVRGNVFVRLRVCSYVYACVRTLTCVFVRLHVCSYVYMCVCTFTCVAPQPQHSHSHTHTHTHAGAGAGTGTGRHTLPCKQVSQTHFGL